MMITLSPKHSVNPSIPICYICNEPKNEVILVGRLKGDKEAPRKAVWSMEPCETCQSNMKQGIILVSVRDGEIGCNDQVQNPFRTGGWVVVTEGAIRRWIKGKALERTLQMRMAFVPDAVWDQIGLPREPTGSEAHQD